MLSLDSHNSYFQGPVVPTKLPAIREVIERYMRDISSFLKSHEINQQIAVHFYDFFEDCLVLQVTKSKLSTYKSKRLGGEIVNGRGKGHQRSKKS